MSWLRKKATRAASKGAPEPTDSPIFGAVIDPAVLREIDAAGPLSWMRKRPERDGLDMTEDNCPEAWAAGRELAALSRRQSASSLTWWLAWTWSSSSLYDAGENFFPVRNRPLRGIFVAVFSRTTGAAAFATGG